MSAPARPVTTVTGGPATKRGSGARATTHVLGAPAGSPAHQQPLQSGAGGTSAGPFRPRRQRWHRGHGPNRTPPWRGNVHAHRGQARGVAEPAASRSQERGSHSPRPGRGRQQRAATAGGRRAPPKSGNPATAVVAVTARRGTPATMAPATATSPIRNIADAMPSAAQATQGARARARCNEALGSTDAARPCP